MRPLAPQSGESETAKADLSDAGSTATVPTQPTAYLPSEPPQAADEVASLKEFLKRSQPDDGTRDAEAKP